MNIKAIAIVVVVLAVSPAWAVNKCTEPDGRVVSRVAPCAANVTAQNSPEAKALAAQFVDESRPPMTRLAALEKLRVLDPVLADRFEPTRKKLAPLATQQAENLRREIDSIGSVMGIKVGMTADQVRSAQHWGNPQRVNTTTGPLGSREQWVYRGGRYVYLQRGIVTSIQH